MEENTNQKPDDQPQTNGDQPQNTCSGQPVRNDPAPYSARISVHTNIVSNDLRDTFTIKLSSSENDRLEHLTVRLTVDLSPAGRKKLTQITSEYDRKVANTENTHHVAWCSKSPTVLDGHEMTSTTVGHRSASAKIEIPRFDPDAIIAAMEVVDSTRTLYNFLVMYLPEEFRLGRFTF